MTDDVARLFQHSKRAEDEFSFLPLISRYCMGLARYTQSPLNEFAALGPDITAVMFDDESQHLVSYEDVYVLALGLTELIADSEREAPSRIGACAR